MTSTEISDAPMTPADPARPLIRSSSDGLPSAVDWAHLLIEGRLGAGDVAVDATAGNGHDTLFLARKTGPGGRVYAFDVQEAAIASTRQRLRDAGISEGSFCLLHCGHEELEERLPSELRGRVKVIMFNLGYLPGSDKEVITRAASTLRAVRSALEWLAPGGLLTVVVYPGHEGGAEEAREIATLFASLPAKPHEVQHLRPVNRSAAPPECWAVLKR